jgi:hypothetical protein
MIMANKKPVPLKDEAIDTLDLGIAGKIALW